jgi:aminoglycoside phosphotransferase (APT) family kinase protein
MGILARMGRGLESLVDKMSQHKVASAIPIGVAGAAYRFLNLQQHMREEYPEGYKLMTQERAVTQAAIILGGYTLLSYMLFFAIDQAGGARNMLRSLWWAATAPFPSTGREELYERIRAGTKLPGHEFGLAHEALYNQYNPEKAAEHVRRAMEKIVRHRYKRVNGRAEHSYSILGKIFFPTDRKKLEKLRQFWNVSDEEANELLRQSSQEEKKSEFLRTAHERGISEVADRVFVRAFLTYELKALDQLEKGNIEGADIALSEMCAEFPSITAKCIYGSFLDTAGSIDDDLKAKADTHWDQVLDAIITDPELAQRFRSIPGSKNEVLEFTDSVTKRGMFVVKRSAEEEGLSIECGKGQFLYDLLGSKGAVPEVPLFRERNGLFYLLQKRVQGDMLVDALAKSSQADLMRAVVETLDDYQRTVQRNRRMTRRYGFELPDLDPAKEYEEKFIRRMQASLQDEEFDFAGLYHDMLPIFSILDEQGMGGVHGDMHARNVIAYDGKRICIIDSEKLCWGARLLDWTNLLLHTKTEHGIDLDEHMMLGYDHFRKRRMSKDEYRLAYSCAAVFKASHMAGSAEKYTRSGDVPKAEGNRRVATYMGEAQQHLSIIRELAPAGQRPQIDKLVARYSLLRTKIRQEQ